MKRLIKPDRDQENNSLAENRASFRKQLAQNGGFYDASAASVPLVLLVNLLSRFVSQSDCQGCLRIELQFVAKRVSIAKPRLQTPRFENFFELGSAIKAEKRF